MRKLAALGLLAVLTTGCGTAPGPAAVAELPPLPAGAEQPFDHFRRDALATIEKADLTFFLDCLAAAGYPQEREVSLGPAPVLPALAAAPLSPRTEADARKYGFGAPLLAQPANVVRKDPAFTQAARGCERSARAMFGAPDEVGRVRSLYADLGNKLVQERSARTTEIINGKSGELTACFAAQGYRVKSGEQFSARGDLSQFGIQTGTHENPVAPPFRRPVGLSAGVQIEPPVPARKYIPTAAEVKFAVAFVRCGVRTGLFAEIDKRQPEIQQAIVERHAAEFAALNPAVDQIARDAAAVLKKRPDQPMQPRPGA
ncbi:hypothetical protein OG394_20955 [Kribbella sp. NBC_01245]|uniref:hypothetical protein n=1 Tax=Kribbella sp. NBC_01245 TaxID=2903578 RepID=UPI002E2965F5|nr:hypothetical protein [Kribbella sp. NBC_01245]